MRKKTIKFGLDNIFWYIIYLLPIIITVCVCLGAFQGDWYQAWYDLDADLTGQPFRGVLGQVLEDFQFIFDADVDSVNPIFAVLCRVFTFRGEQGNILPVFGDISPLLGYIAYFISVYLIHLMVDFVLFIPRLAHKWLNYFTQSED